MKKLLCVGLVLCLLCCGCASNSSILVKSSSDITVSVGTESEAASAITDEALVDRTLYLLGHYIFPGYWYTGDGCDLLYVNEVGMEPLENTPEYTKFFRVLRFDSIKEMKQATEQIVTKEFAENKLYPLLEENGQFLERDGKLYFNTEIGRGGWCGPVSATVISKKENEALLSVVYQDLGGEEEAYNIELKKENDTWKINNCPDVY